MAKKIIIDVELNTSKAVNNIDNVTNSFEELKDTSKGIGGIGESLDSLDGPIKSTIGGVKALGKQFLVLLANPIVAVIAGIAVVLGTLFKAFSRTEAGGNKLNKGMSILSGVFSAFFKVIEPIASFIVDVVVGAFEELGKAADTAASLVSSALEFLGFDDAAESITNFTNATKDLIKDTQELADLEASLLKGRREQRLIEKQALIDAEKLRQLRDDESLSIEERKKKNEELGNVLKKQSEDELKIANQALKAAQLKLKIDGKTTEALDGLAEAQLEILDIQERINGQQSEQLANLNSLRNEEKAIAKERRDRAKEREKKREEERQKEEDARQEKLRKQQEFDDELFRIQNEKDLSEKDKAIQTANEKFDKLFELAQGDAKREKQLLIEQQAEIDAINTDFDQREEDRKKEKGQRLIDLELELKQMAAEAGVVEAETPEEIKAAYDAKISLEDEQFDNDLTRLQEQFGKEFASNEEFLLKKKLLEKKHADDVTKIKKEQADAEKEIDDTKKAVINKNLADTATALSNFSAIAGEETEAGKTLAVAAATINTYRGVSDALAATTITPFETALKFVNAAAIGIAGIQNVKKILSVKTPKGGGGGPIPTAPRLPSPPVGGGSAGAPDFTSGAFLPTQGNGTEDVGFVGTGSGINQQPLRAYVVETDISETQGTINTLEERSEIG